MIKEDKLLSLKAHLNSLERQLENCKWTDKELYNRYLEVEKQIEEIKSNSK